jgi:hypothetical protein
MKKIFRTEPKAKLGYMGLAQNRTSDAARAHSAALSAAPHFLALAP